MGIIAGHKFKGARSRISYTEVTITISESPLRRDGNSSMREDRGKGRSHCEKNRRSVVRREDIIQKLHCEFIRTL